MDLKLSSLEKEILIILKLEETSYANPMPSYELGKRLNVSPAHIRSVIRNLKKLELVGVRKGPGGGYFLQKEVPNCRI